jgi:hypothetical protein
MRHLIIFLSIALLGNAGAATFGLYTYEINPDNVSVTITGYPTDAQGAIEIPAIIDGRSVTSIGDQTLCFTHVVSASDRLTTMLFDFFVSRVSSF